MEIYFVYADKNITVKEYDRNLIENILIEGNTCSREQGYYTSRDEAYKAYTAIKIAERCDYDSFGRGYITAEGKAIEVCTIPDDEYSEGIANGETLASLFGGNDMEIEDLEVSRAPIWYAVQKDPAYDGWDFGSYSHSEAVEMAESVAWDAEDHIAYVVSIDTTTDNPVALDEEQITYED